MAESQLTAKANVGAGTDELLTFTNGTGKHAGAVVLVDSSGVPVSPLTDAELRATPVDSAQFGAWSFSLSGALPAGANTIGAVSINKAALTPAGPATASVGVASALAVALNASRKGLYLKNTSTAGQRVSLGISATAVLDSGITLETGDVFYMDEFSLSTGAVNAIASAAAARLSVQEWS